MEAAQTVASYLYAVSSLPVDEENEPSFMMASIAYLPVIPANQKFLRCISELHDKIKEMKDQDSVQA